MSETHEQEKTDFPIDSIVQANSRANKQYPQMSGPITLATGDAFLGFLVDGKITAGEFMLYKFSGETTARQLDSVNKAHVAYGQYKLASSHITYTWEKDQYATLRALQLFIPKSYTRNAKSSIAYIDNSKNKTLLRRISNLFNAGAQVLKKSETLEKATTYRETFRNFQKRKYEKQHAWTDNEKEELMNNWGIFSDHLRDRITTALMDSNSKLDKPFNDEVIFPFLQEIANRGTRVVARIEHSMY